MTNVGDVVKRGDHVKVKVLSISGTKLSLSMKVSNGCQGASVYISVCTLVCVCVHVVCVSMCVHGIEIQKSQEQNYFCFD